MYKTYKAIPAAILLAFLLSCTREDDAQAKAKLKNAGQELKHDLKKAGDELKKDAHEASREIKKESEHLKQKAKSN